MGASLPNYHSLAMTLNICLQSKGVNVDKTYGTSPSFLNWDNIFSHYNFYKHCYFLESGELLSNMNLPIDAIQCKNIKCININHFNDIDIFYNNIIESLITAVCNTIPVGDNFSIRKTASSYYSIIPGWNSSVKNAHATARNEHLNWLNIGKPLSGPTYCLMKESRRKFKYSLRKCKSDEEQHRADAIAAALYKDPTKKFFWHTLSKNKRQICTSASVGGFSRPQPISDMWKQHYSSLLNCIPETSQNEKDFVNLFIGSTIQNSDVENFKCSVPLLSSLLNNFSLRCSSGPGHLSAHHLRYADPSINIYLSILFNLCLFHGVIPDNY